MTIAYQSGFLNEFATEAFEGALPDGQNSPQKPPYGLYAEQFSGTSFTTPRQSNRHSWLYRILPSARQTPSSAHPNGLLESAPFTGLVPEPHPLRWDPFPIPQNPTDFLEGLCTVAGNGDVRTQAGVGIHVYLANRSMEDRFFYNADGELLLVPQLGRLVLRTELGILEVAPGEIAILPRGMKFRAELTDGEARGYVCENYGPPFRLPELGPIGSNGLANPMDFLSPVAAFEDRRGRFEVVAKFQGRLWATEVDHSPLDVVAWRGNYAPCKYDLGRFNTIGTVSFDHPDPSIFTVLTAPSELPGTANVDFVIFPERWQVAEHTFRTPWFHRNVMSEFMGLVRGTYDARPSGFMPGGASLHNSMTGHGPDARAFEHARNTRLGPEYQADTLAFMFETRWVLHPTDYALESKSLQADYHECWRDLPRLFGAEEK